MSDKQQMNETPDGHTVYFHPLGHKPETDSVFLVWSNEWESPLEGVYATYDAATKGIDTLCRESSSFGGITQSWVIREKEVQT